MLGLLYDIHGNLPALEAVVADARAEGVDRWLLGGDFASWSPWPGETIELLRGLPHATWIRGNGERWLRELPRELRPALGGRSSGLGTDEGWLYSLQAQVELAGVLFAHGSPLSDVESFASEPDGEDERLLAGVRNRTVVFGHSHRQFRRAGPHATMLVNPGSVGMPLDRDPRGAWALLREDEIEFRRSAFDTERVAAAWRSLGGPFAEAAAGRIERGSD